LNPRLIPADDLSSVWGFVEPGLLEILALTQEPWTPVHVEYAIRSGYAWLFVDDDGFFVVQKLKAEWTGAPYLNVWVMWFKPGTAHKHLKGLVGWLDDLKAQTKSDWWEWSSPREGWAWLERLNVCQKIRTVWRRK
jgi:hypothetical protein